MKHLIRLVLLLTGLSLAISCTRESDGPSDGIDRSANLKSLGSSAEDLLSDVKFTSLNIEMVYVEGSKPTNEAISKFQTFLEQRVYKPDGINISLRSVASSGKAPFSIEEIVEIEKQERTAYNAGDEIAVWIYFADGSNEKDENDKFVLGSAFRNTSMVIYQGTIQTFASRPRSPSRATIEAATLNHELGHLFGLVDLGTAPVSDHQDPENQGHCRIDGCLMKASIEFGTGVFDVLEGSGIPQLDQACIDDLQSIGGK
ncbi:hypothetical protein MKO06_14860 [Gramella sp. GC03-9]|uniref:Membrane metalloprotease n=1 Tax=Christiangramia oceanisediminis TaxID=2920386 RepID=A0A9X2RE97_9FLAO|nr:hypothetical protein [Gramella oceanisediminis]MCP9201191.1 hypothetical protein [Gramella oceanisediminis]